MPKTILHIDDEPVVAAALRVRMTAAGYAVISCSSGAQGIEVAQQQHISIILLDIRMPGMDGFETCRRLKADERTASIPVIFLSANAQDASQVAAMECGGVGYIKKPFESATLIEAIESLVDDDEGQARPATN